MLEKLIPFLIPLILIQVSLQVFALIDLKKKTKVKFDKKIIWVFIIVLGQFVGSIIYLTLGGADHEDSDID